MERKWQVWRGARVQSEEVLVEDQERRGGDGGGEGRERQVLLTIKK